MKGIRINMKKIKNNLLSLRIILKELEYKHVFAWITLIFTDKSGVNCVDKCVDRVDINTAVTLL